MLTHLHIKNFAIIEELELEFNSGLTVLTGETGAGKSILMDALSLAIGGRGDMGIIRAGADSAHVTAEFDMSEVPKATAWLEEQSLASDGQCLLRRSLVKDGRGKAFINGIQATVKQLGELGEMLINLHQQQAHQQLAGRARQLAMLDAFGGYGDLCSEVQGLHQSIESCQKRIQAASAKDGQQAMDSLALLNYQLDELASVDLANFEAKDAKYNALASAGTNRQLLEQALEDLSVGELNAVSLLQRQSTQLAEIDAGDVHLEAGRELLSTAGIHLAEAIDELTRCYNLMQENPEHLHDLELYLERVHDLARKHKIEPAALAALEGQMKEQKAQLQEDSVTEQALVEKLHEMQTLYNKQALKLRAKRKKAALAMSKAVSSHLLELGMAGGRFQVSVSELSGQCFSTGMDAVSFQVSGGKHQPLGPLDKVASGGEMSRISIAIQLVATKESLPPTMVFDEADAGIGGGTGEQVGLLLGRLASQTQVICATHLPQVAVFGWQHLYAEKGSQKAGLSCVRPLSEKERRTEIARMLDGRASDEKSLAHADEMLKRVAAL